jgi:hypothetical protein
LASCAWEKPDGSVAFSHYSNKEYQQKIGLKKAQKKRRFWMSEAGLKKAMNELPSGKTPSPDEMLRHISALFIILDRVLVLNGMQRARSLHFSSIVCGSGPCCTTFAGGLPVQQMRRTIGRW